MLVCRHCGWENPDEAAFCTNCGRPLQRQRTLDRRPVEDDRSEDVIRPVARPVLPKLKAPPEPGRMAHTLLDFRMPSDMLAELSKLRGEPAPAADDDPGEVGAAAEGGDVEPLADEVQPPVGTPTVDENPPSPQPEDSDAASAEQLPPELMGTVELPIPVAVAVAVAAAEAPAARVVAVENDPAADDPAPEAADGDLDDPPSDDGPVAAGPSTIVELPPVLLVTEPPVPSPPPVPVQPEGGSDEDEARPAEALVLPVLVEEGAEPSLDGDDEPVQLPPPEPEGDVVLLGEPVIEPDPFMVEADGLPASDAETETESPADAPADLEDDGSAPPPALSPSDSARPAPPPRLAAELRPSEPPSANSEDRPLPGTDRVVPAEEIAIRSRPPQAVDAEALAEPAKALRSVALSDIAKALRAEASAADRADESDEVEPLALSLPAGDEDGSLEVPDESMDGFEGLDLAPADRQPAEPEEDRRLAPARDEAAASDDDDHDDHDDDDDGFVDLVEPADDEPSDEALVPPLGGDVEVIEDASMPPPPAAAVALVAEALESDGPHAMLSTDELEELRPGGPPPVPMAQPGLVLRVMNREVGDDVVVEVGRNPLIIGSGNVDLSIEDAWLSARHARVATREGRLHVEDLQSLNGVWVRVRAGVHLAVGERFIIGRQICEIASESEPRLPRTVDGVRRLGAPPSASDLQLRVLAADGRVARSVRLTEEAIRLGRHLGEVVFTDDSHLSATHAALRVEGARVRLDDLGSRNGTWVRLRAPRSLEPGDSFLTGRTIWRIGAAIR